MARDLRSELGFRPERGLLFNGSLLLHLSSPTVGQRLLRSRHGPLFPRLTSERSFHAQFSRVFSSDHPLSAEEAADQGRCWHGAIRDWPGALTLAWGLRDPVATVDVLEGLRALRPGVEVVELPDAAHYPQIECPERIASGLDTALIRKAGCLIARSRLLKSY